MNNQESIFSNRPLVAMSLPPYANLADASTRFVHELPIAHSTTPHENTFVICLPLESQITLAEWLPGMLRLRLRAAMAGHQMDIFFWKIHESRVIGARSISDPQSAIDIDVPEGTSTIAGHLLNLDNAIVQSFVLHAPYTFAGEASSALSIEQQIRADISAGENENREMKAFFNPDQNKEMRDRVLHSAIAFANGSGGRIYVGVEDDGDFSGNGKLLRILANARQIPEEAARELSAKIKKVIVEATRPVIQARTYEAKIVSEWVICLEIQASDDIVSTHNNQVFIRAGASNRIPDPSWFKARGYYQGVP